MSGQSRLEEALAGTSELKPMGPGELKLMGPGELKLMGHGVCGYPDLGTSTRIFLAMARAGTDIIEAQLPFSEPSADGPAIVQANHAALRAFARAGGGADHGALGAASTGARGDARSTMGRTGACLEALGEVRRAAGVPVLVMSYVNPILSFGPAAFVREAARLGLDGLIVPDYPDDEPELGLARLCREEGLALLPLIAPTTSMERAVALCASFESPLLYAVLRMGVTGRKTELDEATAARLTELRRATGKKVAAGFGLRERSQLDALRGLVDCAIVGTALVSAAREAIEAGSDPATAVAAFIRGLRGK